MFSEWVKREYLDNADAAEEAANGEVVLVGVEFLAVGLAGPTEQVEKDGALLIGSIGGVEAP